MNVVIIGGGVMGEAILRAALSRGVFAPADVTVTEVVEARRGQLEATHGVRTTPDAESAIADASLVVLAVKPQDIASVRGRPRADALVLSIMAGVRIATIATQFGHDRIVRVMPNTPVAAMAGMSVWTATDAVTGDQRELTRSLLQSFGRELYVDSESKIDMATAVSGSGPGYVFLAIEALIEGAVAIGLPRAQAEELVLQTVYGSALYARESGRSPAELRAMVTSPAGTTAAGLLELERAGLRAAFIDCIQAAYDRAQELGEAK